MDQIVNDERLVYLDNAATSQKPKEVIDAVSNYFLRDNANVHRGVHTLAERATEQFEQTRFKVKNLINAKSEREIVYTKGTTEGLLFRLEHKLSNQAMRLSFPTWNIIQTSFPGRFCAKKRVPN